MAISRRSFLKGSGLAAASSLVAPALFGNPFVREAFADTIGDRYFLSVYLDGGNDGFNTVIPVDNGGATLRTAYDVALPPGEREVPKVRNITSVPRHGARIVVTRSLEA